MHQFSSDSDYNMSDSEGFNNFMDESDSSSGYVPKLKSNAKQVGRPVENKDEYAYELNFDNIKVPTKAEVKSKKAQQSAKPAAKKSKNLYEDSSSSSSRPIRKPVKMPSNKNEYNKMVKKLKGDSSDDSEIDESLESSEYNKQPKKKNYLDSSSDLSESNDTYNIKTEPFITKINQPISLNKKIDPKDVGKDIAKPGKNEKKFFKEKKKIGKMSPLSSDLFNSSEIGSEFKQVSENSEEDSDYSESQSQQLREKMGTFKKYSSESSGSNSLYQSNIEKKGQIEKFSENFSVKPLENLRNIKESKQQSESDHPSDYYESQEENEYTENQTGNPSEYQSNPEDTQYIRNSDKESGKYVETEGRTENQSEYYSENFEAYESQQLVDSHPGLPKSGRGGKVGESIFKINEVENEDESRNVKTPAVDVRKIVPRPQTTNEYMKTRERELEIELVDLRRLVANLESELESKQEQLFYYEKREKQSNFAKIEYEALEKAKTQLREAFHKIELYKIETEELIKQVDYNEARVRDLEAENNLIKSDMERKEKLAEERMKLTESRTSERLVKEMTRQFELEKEDFIRRKNEMEIEFSRTKSELAKLEGENRELRTRLFSLRENEEKIRDLEQQNFMLSQKGTVTEVIDQAKEPVSEALKKEIVMQDQLISGFQRENEKLTLEIRKLKAQIKDEQLRSHQENRKVDLLKSNLIRDHGGVLIKENVSDLASINELAGGTVINKEEYLALKDNVARLSRELMEKERNYRERELEYCEQIENLKKFRFESEYMITSMQRSQGFGLDKASNEKFEQDKKEIVERYEREILLLQDRISILAQNRTEDNRVKFLEEHVRSLEEALKQKEPISTLIKAVKPESSDQVNFLLGKISDLEEKLKKSSNSMVKKGGKTVSKTHPKVAEGGLQEKIRLLEKQLEETKNYYISKLSAIKPDSSEELKHLREQVLNYERVIDGIERQKKNGTQGFKLLPFLSSYSGLVWCQICQEVNALQTYIVEKSTKEMIHVSSKLIEILESTSASPSFTNITAFDRILDKTLGMFSLLKGIPNWVSIEKVFTELSTVINTELNSALQGEPVEGSEFEEEYWSDFSDTDQEQEEIENSESLEILKKIKNGLGYLTRIGGGWLDLSQVQEILSSNLPDLNTISLRNMLRKISPSSGQINIDQFLKDIRENTIQWWEEKLRTFLWEQKEKISIKGNYCSVVHKNFVPWITEGILEKVENYVEKEGIDCDMLTEQLFCGNLALSKRAFRIKVLEHKLPLTREECHVLAKELDKGKVGQINAKVFLGFIKRTPKQAWLAKPAEALGEYRQLSERDASFLLVQANKRISELESQLKQQSNNKVNLNTDYTLSLKLKATEEELESAKSKMSYIISENEKLKMDKVRLENHMSKQPVSVGASEYLALQRKIELIEENHYRREQELRNLMSGMTFKSEQEIIELKKRFEIEKIQLQKIVNRKNQEINEFKTELEELLKEIELLRARKRGK